MQLITQRLAFLIAILATLSSHAADTHWVASWGSSAVQQPDLVALMGPPPPGIVLPSSTIVQGTVRFRLPVSRGGQRIVLRVSNEAGKAALLLGAVTVAIADAGLTARAGTLRRVTFGQQGTLTIPLGAPALSDPIDLPVKSADALVVSFYLPTATELPPGPAGLQAASIKELDATQAAVLKDATPLSARPIVSAILVASDTAAKTIVAFGDSITDGSISTTPDVRGWPGHLAQRLMQSRSHRQYAIVNEGIGGNRVLRDGMGISALARFDRDVFALPSVSHIILLEGINDIGFPGIPGRPAVAPEVSADELIAAYRQLIARAHQHGVKIIGGTLLPFRGAFYFTEAGEQTRVAVNAWIRGSKEFDGVIDFESSLRDSAEPSKLAAVYDSGDHLHPNDAGYAAMAAAVDLAVFNKTK